MRVEEILDESCVLANLHGKTKQEALHELLGALKVEKSIGDVGAAVKIVLERERLGSTGIGDGVAIPHGKMKNISRILCAFGRSKAGVDFDAVDDKPVHIIVLLLAPEGSVGLHLKVLSRISKILRDASFRRRLMELPDTPAIYKALLEEDRNI